MKKGNGIAQIAVAFMAIAFMTAFAPLAAEETPREEGSRTESERTVTVDEAVALAMENNIALTSAAIDVRVKKRGKDLAWNVFIPSVQATGTLTRANNVSDPLAMLAAIPMLGYTSPSMSEADHWRAILGVNLSLNVNMALFEGLKATRQGYEAGLIGYEQARAITEAGVRKAFYAILLADGSLGIARGKLATSEQRYAQTLTNWKNGLAPELSLLQTQLAVEQQRPIVMEAERAVETAKGDFAFLIGLPLGTKLRLDGAIDPTLVDANADELIAKHLAGRLDLALQAKMIEMTKTAIRANRLQRYTPFLQISQSFGTALSPIDAGTWSDDTGAFSLTLGMELSGLLPFSSAGQTAADKNDELAKMDLQLKEKAYAAELEVRNLIKQLEKSETSIKTMELSVALAKRAHTLTEQGYRAGTIEYLDLKDAETSLLQAELGVLNEKFNYISTLLDLETALNAKLN